MSDSLWNGIRIEGKPDEISKLKQFIKGSIQPYGETELVDFSKIIPIPKDLELGPNPSQELITKHIDWCNENWGCKWNVGYSKYLGNNKIFFATINGGAFKVIRALSTFFPEIKMYFFEYFDNEYYCCTILDGKVIKSNFEIEDQAEYVYESDYAIDFFRKFYAESTEAEYYPGYEPDAEPEYGPDVEPIYAPDVEPDVDPKMNPYEAPDYYPDEATIAPPCVTCDANWKIWRIINRT